MCHEGPKASRAIFLKNELIFTTGFSRVSERQYSLRAPNYLHEPLVVAEVDTSNGIIFPLYDPDTSMVYLCGKVSDLKHKKLKYLKPKILNLRGILLFATSK